MRKNAKWKRSLARRQEFFRNNAQVIAHQNLSSTRWVSLATAILVAALCLITPLFIQNWHISRYHVLFVPALLAIHAAASLYQKKGRYRPWTVALLCMLMECVVVAFVFMIDLVDGAETPASFMPLICIGMPVVFVFPFWFHFGVIALYDLCFIIGAFHFESLSIAPYDAFLCVAGFALSILIAEVVMRLRVQEYRTRMRYKRRSEQDPLSGILNKGACEERVRAYLHERGSDSDCALLILDLDRFKQVNDRWGHYTGDMLLRLTGELLRSTFYPGDIIGRIGGDEFMVLVRDCGDRQVVSGLCGRLQERMTDFSASVVSEPVTCSIGGALVHHAAAEFDDLYRQADAALYEAKRTGRARFHLSEFRAGGTENGK